MENYEIMTNEEVVEATEGIAVDSGKGFKVVAGIGLAVLIGGITYEYAIKPIVAKIKAKKEALVITVEAENADEDVEIEE